MFFINRIQAAAERLCKLRGSGEFVPLVESDVCGLLYHLLLAEGQIPLAKLHLDARVVGGGSGKFDIAIGPILFTACKKPMVDAAAVVEVKAFPLGFSNRQHRVRFEHILNNDLRKLGGLQENAERASMVFDEAGYLEGKYDGRRRLDVLIEKRDSGAPGTALVLLRKIDGSWMVDRK